MEPMTMGSPVGTTSNPSSPVSAVSPYLPAYLMGDAVAGAAVRARTVSPVKPQKQMSFGPTPPLSPPKTPQTPVEPRLILPLVLPEKSNGPPTKGLFDTVEASFSAPKLNGYRDLSFQEMNACMQTVPASDLRSVAPDHTWVTVFGFPPSAASFVAMQFYQCGNVVDRRCPGKGNWMHLRYQSPLEARKALNNNGKVFSGNIMVGVTRCQDNEVLQDSHYKDEVLLFNGEVSTDADRSAGTAGTPMMPYQYNTSYSTPNSRPNTSNLSYLGSPVRIGNARPLGQAYRTAQADSEVVTRSNIPQRSTSIVAKAMEYVFGW